MLGELGSREQSACCHLAWARMEGAPPCPKCTQHLWPLVVLGGLRSASHGRQCGVSVPEPKAGCADMAFDHFLARLKEEGLLKLLHFC